jgi:hypothetical protein
LNDLCSTPGIPACIDKFVSYWRLISKIDSISKTGRRNLTSKILEILQAIIRPM